MTNLQWPKREIASFFYLAIYGKNSYNWNKDRLVGLNAKVGGIDTNSGG